MLRLKEGGAVELVTIVVTTFIFALLMAISKHFIAPPTSSNRK